MERVETGTSSPPGAWDVDVLDVLCIAGVLLLAALTSLTARWAAKR